MRYRGLALIFLIAFLAFGCSGKDPPTQSANTDNSTEIANKYTRTYNVDLLVSSDEELDSLIADLTSAVAPERWKRSGGKGAATAVYEDRAIFVVQSEDVIDPIADFLELRRRQDPNYEEKVREKYDPKCAEWLQSIVANHTDSQLIAYQLGKPQKENPEELHGWEIITRRAVESQRDRTVIETSLKDPGSFVYLDEAKMCIFSPGLGFTWKGRNSRIDMLVCLGCEEIKIYHDGSHTKHCDLTADGKERLTELYVSLFKDVALPSN